MRSEAEEVTLAIRDEIALQNVDHLIHTTRTRCNGRCADSCVVIMYPDGRWYEKVTPEIGRQLVQSLVQGVPFKTNVSYEHEIGKGLVANAHIFEGDRKSSN